MKNQCRLTRFDQSTSKVNSIITEGRGLGGKLRVPLKTKTLILRPDRQLNANYSSILIISNPSG